MIGIGMMNFSSDGIMKGMASKAFTHTNEKVSNTYSSVKWECANCKKENEGEFCSNCGAKKPEESFCVECGNKIEKDAKFCSKCGKKIN